VRVEVPVDQARHEQMAGKVDNTLGGERPGGRDGLDPVAFDQDVARLAVELEGIA
jgi:hypothetical protein